MKIHYLLKARPVVSDDWWSFACMMHSHSDEEELYIVGQLPVVPKIEVAKIMELVF